ncbi:E3 ubiquitin-protein ligase CCNB1IP1 [Glycine max]|nr:E3 ubiquitin-protein ligase CCNB1IP1 [Glycine max]
MFIFFFYNSFFLCFLVNSFVVYSGENNAIDPTHTLFCSFVSARISSFSANIQLPFIPRISLLARDFLTLSSDARNTRYDPRSTLSVSRAVIFVRQALDSDLKSLLKFFCLLKGTDDANKILSNDGACPICDQVLSKSLMKPVDVNPNDEWVNMAMAGVSPQILMKSAYRSVMFYLGQKELEMQFKMNKIVAQCRQKCEMMQEKFTEKIEQVHTAYQKMAKKCQMMQQEIESLTKDNQELQEKFAEKSRQKRKLDEMYDQLRNEYDSVKRSAIQPADNFYSRNEHDLFSNPPNIMDGREMGRKGGLVFTPATPGPREDVWPARQNSNNSGHFDLSVGSPAKQTVIAGDAGNRRAGAHPVFGPGATNNPSMTLRNLILSPIKRPQLSRNRPQLFTL